MIKINDSKDFEIIKYGTYALAELCYSCGSVNCVSGEKASKVISILHNRLEWIEDIMNKISSSGANYSSAKQTKKWLLLGMQILKGEEISNEQEKMFLGVREEY